MQAQLGSSDRLPAGDGKSGSSGARSTTWATVPVALCWSALAAAYVDPASGPIVRGGRHRHRLQEAPYFGILPLALSTSFQISH